MAAALKSELFVQPKTQVLGVMPVEQRHYWSNQDWQRNLRALLVSAVDFDPASRLRWLQDIRRTVLLDSEFLDAKTLACMAEVAGWMCDWNLQILLLDKLSVKTVLEQQQFLYACWKMGARELALQQLRAALLGHPKDDDLYDIFRHLQGFSDQVPVYGSQIRGEVLRLEYLDTHHLTEFHWQYFDPDIAVLCNLPNYGGNESWLSWLAQQQRLPDQVTFAVMHEEWGFIGVVSLIVQGKTGFFYYWIGRDYRGHGWGPQAVHMLLEWGSQMCGIDCCFARVLQHNAASRTGLAKLGFVPLGLSNTKGGDKECFYYLGEPANLNELTNKLNALLKSMGSNNISFDLVIDQQGGNDARS